MVEEKQGVLGRGMRLGKIGLSLTGSYLAYQLQNVLFGSTERHKRRQSFHKKASRRARKELELLKGPAMKVGQILSMMGHVLPEEVIEELSQLQGRAPGMHPTMARAQFKTALGKYPEEMFREFDESPFAAASLGQVHRAVTKNGERVAVKIQYPAIRTAIENDFKLLRSASIPGRLTGFFPDSLINEVQTGFLKETNYLNEARNIEFFRQQFTPFDYIELPQVYPKLSNERILTMSLLEGVHIEDFLATKPSARIRNLIGYRLAELYHFQLRQARAFHADPHPGNYLFREDGTIGLVDFGCVKFSSPALAQLADSFFCRAWLGGEAEFNRMIPLILGANASSKSPQARRILKAIIEFYNLVFPTDTPGEHDVDFGDIKFMRTLTGLWDVAVRNKFVNPEFAFASRAELGLYNLLHKLGARVDTAKLRQHVTELQKKLPPLKLGGTGPQ